MPRIYTRRDPADRFWEKVDRNGPLPARRPDLGNCWLWTGAKASKSRWDGGECIYGNFWDGERYVGPHRFSLQLAGHTLDPQLHADHLCAVTLCVRPTHLEQVPARVNWARIVSPMQAIANGNECAAGHEYTEQNTRWIKNAQGDKTRRQCRRCDRERKAKKKLRESAA